MTVPLKRERFFTFFFLHKIKIVVVEDPELLELLHVLRLKLKFLTLWEVLHLKVQNLVNNHLLLFGWYDSDLPLLP